jgi:hypothetical protein
MHPQIPQIPQIDDLGRLRLHRAGRFWIARLVVGRAHEFTQRGRGQEPKDVHRLRRLRRLKRMAALRLAQGRLSPQADNGASMVADGEAWPEEFPRKRQRSPVCAIKTSPWQQATGGY